MPYIGNSPGTGTRNRFIYTATASQTTFSGADDNGKTLKYADSDYVDVYLNGICLVPVTDYTSTSKTSIVLTQAASLNDTLEVVAYDIATISDTVSKADGGQFDGAVTVEADFTVDSNTLHVDSANNKVGILDDAPDGALHVYNGMLQVGSKDGDTSIQQNTNAIRIAAVPNSSTEWGGLQWYREFSNYIGAEIIAARASATESDTDLILKTSSTAANASERMRITHDGNICVGRTSVLNDFGDGRTSIALQGTGSADYSTIQLANYGTTNNSQILGILAFYDGTNENSRVAGQRDDATNSGILTFWTADTGSLSEKMRIDSGGTVLVGHTTVGSTQLGCELRNGDGSGYGFTVTNDGNDVVSINRATNDGTLVALRGQNTIEGTISVSGTTVSYNGGHLSRWSQLTDGSEDTSIVKGTVMTNLDQMAVWSHDAVAATYYEEGDELPEGVSVGDEKTAAVDAYTEENEQLNCMAVSSVEGDANVAGVFVNWDNTDDGFNDMNVAMTGDMVIRVAQGTTVARGDLLMSAGDGTAKPQGDDIVRSKTIAKVTSINVSHTYDDGSYLVPCVLMAC